MNCDNAAVRPIHYVKRLLVFRRIFRAGAEFHACRRADPDVERGRQAVRIPVRPFGGAFAKTVIAAVDDVIDANGPIPRRAPVPFHVAVEAKPFAVWTEIDVVGVAETGGEQLNVLAVGIQARDETSGRFFAGAKSVPILL